MPVVGQITFTNPAQRLVHESEMAENDPGRTDIPCRRENAEVLAVLRRSEDDGLPAKSETAPTLDFGEGPRRGRRSIGLRIGWPLRIVERA